jgi:hypothetical protein
MRAARGFEESPAEGDRQDEQSVHQVLHGGAWACFVVFLEAVPIEPGNDPKENHPPALLPLVVLAIPVYNHLKILSLGVGVVDLAGAVGLRLFSCAHRAFAKIV